MQPQQPGDRERFDEAFFIQIIRYLDGEMSADEVQRFNAELRSDDAKLEAFAQWQMQSLMVFKEFRHAAVATLPHIDPPIAGSAALPASRSIPRWAWMLCALAASFLVVLGAFQMGRQHPGSAATAVVTASSIVSQVRLSAVSDAAFFGQLTPAIGSEVPYQAEQVLTRGGIELVFPSGASAIIESPAIFRVLSDERLSIDLGTCSVHAPPGAEGFQVWTPAMQVVDRGTRFVVHVSETSSTDVQVIEGAADAYQEQQTKGDRLEQGDAKRFKADPSKAATEIQFTPELYRAGLPDRLLSYDAATDENGFVTALQSVKVQRAGLMRQYAVDDLITARVTNFRANAEPDTNGHFVASGLLPADRLALLSDRLLNTGIINPGSATGPLLHAPTEGTPGLTIRFDRPVRNQTGPDVVFFEIQCLANPVEGDAFHISPVQWSATSKSHTVNSYDISSQAQEAKRVSPFKLFKSQTSIQSLDQLRTGEFESSPVRLPFYVIAVGIDLSDLGYDEPSDVTELFIQSHGPGLSLVDPVFIAGLPEDRPSGSSNSAAVNLGQGMN